METSNPKQSKRRTGILAFLVFIIYSLLIVLIFWPADPSRQRAIVGIYETIEERLKVGDSSVLYHLLEWLRGPELVEQFRQLTRRTVKGLEEVRDEELVRWMQDNIKLLEFNSDSKQFEIRAK